MGLFGRGSKEHQGWPAGTAFVLYGEAPPEGAPSFGKGSDRSIGLQVQTAGSLQQVTVRAKNNAETWIIPGTDVPVRIDPADPGHVEVAWDQIPSMEDRVAAQDRALVDPIGAQIRVAEARRLGPGDRRERLAAALDAAAGAPAPRGQVRAVVMVAAVRGRAWIDAGTHNVSTRWDSAAVLSVNVPGREPYAAYVAKFKTPVPQESAVDQELPALVSASDPNAIEILWDEVTSDAEFSARTVSDRLADSAAGTDPLSRVMGAMGQAGGGFASARFDPDAMARQRAASIEATLARVQDPVSRKAMIDQYRAMGFDMDDDGRMR